MTMFFASPNYTQIPNDFFEVVLPTGPSKSELAVALAIFRETFGWRRRETELLTIDDLQRMTGLARASVVDGVKKGEERGYIASRRVAGGSVYGVRVGGESSKFDMAESSKSDVDSSKIEPPSNNQRKVKERNPPNPPGGDQQLQHPPSSGELWIDDVVSEVFEAWRIGTGKNGNSTLSPPRKKKIRLRLEEAMNGDGLAGARAEVLEAVAGMVNSTWHRENGHQEFSQLFRSRDTVEKFVTRFRKDNGGAATTIPRGQSPTPKGPNAEYDTTRKNPELED